MKALLAAVIIIAALAAAIAATGGAVSPSRGFGARVDNPWFPLLPGSVWVYHGVKDGKRSRDVMTVTRRTAVVDGAPCVVVTDRLYLAGTLEERTTEWYSQDRAGNVWYFGENTAELDRAGHVTTTSGSWRAGVDGARAGIFMYAHPVVGQAAQQEYYRGQAQDRFRVVALHTAVSAPFVHSHDALLTQEWTPLEPRVLDHKLYVRGIGTVLEQTVRGGDERNALVSFTRGR